MKVTLNIPDELIKQIDEQKDRLHINRTAYIVTALSQKIQSEMIMNQLPVMQKSIDEMQKLINENNNENKA